MNAPPERVADDELHAYLDGELDAARVPLVAAWLQAHPEDAARVLQWQAQGLQLRRLARGVELGETPAALTATVQQAARGVRRWAPWQQALAAVLLLALGVAGGRWRPLSATPADQPTLAASPPFVREAVRAHAVFVPERRHPVEVAAADEAHLVQWLSRRLGAPLKAPSLAGLGYQLLGGRLLPGEGTPRAQFMYENASGARVTLFVAVFGPGQAPAPTAFRAVRNGAEQSFYWVEDRFGYALSGELEAPQMMALAREVYAQLDR